MSENHPTTQLPEPINKQMTPSETQPASPNLYMAIAQALANAANNAVNAQQQSYTTMLAATTMGVEALYTLDSAAPSTGSQQILQTQTELEEAMKSFLITPSAALLDASHNSSTTNDFSDSIRLISEAFAASLDKFGETAYLQMLRIIQLAAIASSLAALIKTPEQAENYERVLAIIKNLR